MSATLAAAAPFVTQLLKTGLDRAGSILLKKFMRLRGLDKTLRAGTYTNPAVETAIRDFETILGSYLENSLYLSRNYFRSSRSPE